MRKGKIALSILCLVFGFLSCNKDDGGNNIPEIVLEDRTEQQAKDKDSIVNYLNEHYYNASAFVNNPDPSIKDLIITTITDEVISSDADSLLMNAVELKKITFAEAEYEFYILNLNPSATGDAPNFSDEVLVNYEGFTLDNQVFDSAVTPVNFDLTSLVPGWRKAMPFFNSAEFGSFVIQGDGTVDYMNHGVGVMFLPSGLAYFNNSVTGIPSYTSIAFKFDLIQTSITDHDNDGVPSYLEDVDGDGELFNDNTDGDFNPNTRSALSNYLDNDDDGDGVLTKDEIVIKTYNKPTKAEIEAIDLASNEEIISIVEEQDGTFTGTTITFTDTDGDGTPDYLDAE